MKKVLSGAVKKNRLAGSYLFFGPEGVGKWATALELAKGLNCQEGDSHPCENCASCKKIANLAHPDVKVLFPLPSVKTDEERQRFMEEKIREPYSTVNFDRPSNIPVEEIRKMQRELSLKPYEVKRRVVIIYQAERMISTGQNYLLKNLEEPPLDTVMMLTSSEPGKFLPTILSRCQKIRFSSLSDKLIEDYLKKNCQLDPKQAGYYSKISRGSLGRALSLINSEKGQIREDGLDLIWSALEQDLVDSVELVRGLIRKWDRDCVLEMFDFLFTLFRDIYLYLEQRTEGNLINVDLKEKIVRIADILKRKDLAERGMHLINKTKRNCISRNANLELSLLALVTHWRSWSRR